MMASPILLVDDEPDLRASLKEFLTQDGYWVEEAESFRTALDLVGQRHYPVIVTDLNMPGGLSGLDLISAVKAKDPRALCIVITGYATLDASIQALKAGAYDFIQKPFKLAELEAVLDRALDHSELRDKLAEYQSDLESRVVARIQEQQRFHAEVLALNELLLAALGETEEARLASPFLDYLDAHFHPDGVVVLKPGGPGGWDILHRAGSRPWAALGTLPKPGTFQDVREWGWEGGYPDGYFIPLVKGELPLGALFLGFEVRSAFHPEDALFVLWRKQLEAALYSLSRTRAAVAEAVTRQPGSFGA